MKSYDYATRKGIRPISWEEFALLGRQLAEQLNRAGVEAIVGNARAGLFPATLAACALRKELYPVRLTRRREDQVVRQEPVWITPLGVDLTGKVVAVVDEIADSGQTLQMAAEDARRKGARSVITACLVSHSWAEPAPDVVALVTDELVIFPWDREVLEAGKWVPHPEIEAAIKAQEAKK